MSPRQSERNLPAGAREPYGDLSATRILQSLHGNGVLKAPLSLHRVRSLVEIRRPRQLTRPSSESCSLETVSIGSHRATVPMRDRSSRGTLRNESLLAPVTRERPVSGWIKSAPAGTQKRGLTAETVRFSWCSETCCLSSSFVSTRATQVDALVSTPLFTMCPDPGSGANVTCASRLHQEMGMRPEGCSPSSERLSRFTCL